MYFTDLRERDSRVRVLKITQNTGGGAGTKACVLHKPCRAKDAVFVANMVRSIVIFALILVQTLVSHAHALVNPGRENKNCSKVLY